MSKLAILNNAQFEEPESPTEFALYEDLVECLDQPSYEDEIMHIDDHPYDDRLFCDQGILDVSEMPLTDYIIFLTDNNVEEYLRCNEAMPDEHSLYKEEESVWSIRKLFGENNTESLYHC